MSSCSIAVTLLHTGEDCIIWFFGSFLKTLCISFLACTFLTYQTFLDPLDLHILDSLDMINTMPLNGGNISQNFLALGPLWLIWVRGKAIVPVLRGSQGNIPVLEEVEEPALSLITGGRTFCLQEDKPSAAAAVTYTIVPDIEKWRRAGNMCCC